MCGKIFADLGAEVIKVEPPGGCSTRRIPPFLEDEVGLDRGLYFIAYQAGKKSVTANLESADGRAIVAELAKKCDFLVESFPLGYLDSIGLGYDALAKLNPRLIYTSITPFGDTGPGKDYKWADIITWAAGGMMYLMGEEGSRRSRWRCRRPDCTRAREAAVASLIAHYPRQIRRTRSARRRQHAGLHRVDPDERAGDADPARRTICAHRRLRRVARRAAQDGFPMQGRLHLERHRRPGRNRPRISWIG